MKSHSKAEGSTFFDTMRLSSFFRHCETDFFPIFLLLLPSVFDILQQNGCSKNLKASPFYIFRQNATYRKLQKHFEKKLGNFFSQFLVFREFLLSPVVEKVVLVFESF